MTGAVIRPARFVLGFLAMVACVAVSVVLIVVLVAVLPPKWVLNGLSWLLLALLEWLSPLACAQWGLGDDR